MRLVERVWRGLPGHDRYDIDGWLEQVLPVVLSAQRASVALTEGYLAQSLERQPIGVDVEALIGSNVRNGTTPEEVYQRPFVTLWSGLKEGSMFEDAYDKALDRAKSSAATDVQLSMRATASAVQEADPGFFGFKRKADPDACTFCQLVDGAYVKRADAMPLHPFCGCGLEVLTQPHPHAALLPNGVAVHEHGELGPILADPAHDFTTASEALA